MGDFQFQENANLQSQTIIGPKGPSQRRKPPVRMGFKETSHDLRPGILSPLTWTLVSEDPFLKNAYRNRSIIPTDPPKDPGKH